MEQRTMGNERGGHRRRGGRWPRLGFGLLLVLLLVGGGAFAPPAGVGAQETGGELPPTAAVAPETALMYFSLDLDLQSDQWQRIQDLLARAGFPTAVEDLQRGFLDDAGLATPSAEGDASVLEPLFGGELAVVFTGLPPAALEGLQSSVLGPTDLPLPVATPAAGEAEVTTGLAAVLLPGDPDAAYDFLLDELEVAADDSGDAIDETVYRDVTITAQTDEFDGPVTAIARVDDFVLVSTAPADLEPLIDTATGETGSLLDFDPMADVRAELGSDLALFGFVNGPQLLDALGPEAAESLEALAPAGSAMQSFESLAGFGVWADDPGLRIDAVALAAEGSALPDLPDNFDPTLDERVPADSFFFADGVDLGPSGALTGVALILAQSLAVDFATGMAGAGAEATPVPTTLTPDVIEDQFAAAEAALGFDLRADLIDQLVGEYAIAGSVGILPTGFGGVFVSDVADAATVDDSLRQVARLIEQDQGGAGIDVSVRRLGDDTVYVARDPSDETTPAVEFGVVGGQLLVGLGTGIDDYVAGSARPLADDERYQQVMATLPDEHNQVLYVNLTGILPLAFGVAAVDSDLGGEDQPVDSALACADYETQADAQAAADEGGAEAGDLDQDLDGQACEDFFGPAAAGATPTASGSLSAVEAYAQVAYEREGLVGTSGILYIAES